MSDGEALLVLEDGRNFAGRAVGAPGQVFGEVVFNTSMTGYQEILSDPSYCGQIVTFTTPHVGNCGVCPQDDQADRPRLSGLVVRELSSIASNFRATETLEAYLLRHGIAGITEVDTRALTRHLRERGAMRGGIFPAAWNLGATAGDLLALVRSSPSLVGLDLTPRVTCREPYRYAAEGPAAGARSRYRVALIDCGVKRGILRELACRGIEVQVLPAAATEKDVRALAPDGLVLSNGPGDPAAVHPAIATTRALLGTLPILGICLGHQILGLALGGRTFKLPFGHHGGNHPVREGSSGEVWITAQNHGFAVDPKSLPAPDVEVTHLSLYDGTLEGFRSRKHRLIAVQFHPEAGPGPSDAGSVFDRFAALLEQGA